MRLARFISRAGHCSRRAASRLIDAGQVMVDGKAAGHLTFVDGREKVSIGEISIRLPQTFRYVIYNKPVGVDCNCLTDDPSSIVNRLKFIPQLFPVGRLDKDSHGLLLLTNDGELCHRLLSPQFNHPKTYLVTVTPFHGLGNIDTEFIEKMTRPMALKQGMTKPCRVEIIAPNQFKITLTQGMNRQIRKMSQSCGYRVTELQRISLVNLELAKLAVGEWRDLTDNEVGFLKSMSSG